MERKCLGSNMAAVAGPVLGAHMQRCYGLREKWFDSKDIFDSIGSKSKHRRGKETTLGALSTKVFPSIGLDFEFTTWRVR